MRKTRRLTISRVTKVVLLIFGIIALWLLQPTPGEEDASRVFAKAVLKSAKISDELKLLVQANVDNSEDQHKWAEMIIISIRDRFQVFKAFRRDPVKMRANVRREEVISTLVDKLLEHASLAQEEVIAFLEELGLEYKSLWIENEIVVKDVYFQVILEIATRFEEVRRIRLPGVIKPPRQVEKISAIQPPQAISLQPLEQIRGRCSDIKCLGNGVVVAIIDTGAMWLHSELVSGFRRSHGWYDPINKTKHPTDNNGHGTHMAGLIVGRTKGVAPKAQWIACLGLQDDELLSELAIKLCGQWALCPHKSNNESERDCSKAPHIISNSWASTPPEQRTPKGFFYKTQMAWNEVGIISVFSAGNDGPYCTTVEPPAMYGISFAVGAIDSQSSVAWWSSRGPVVNMRFDSARNSHYGTCRRQCDISAFMYGSEVCTLITKPDIAAPGVEINSSWTGLRNAYRVQSGTGEAAAIVAGVAALMVCANERFSGGRKLDQGRAVRILKYTASTSTINLADGNELSEDTEVNNYAEISNYLCNMAFDGSCLTFPNNLYGYGEVDACKAVQEVVRQAKLDAEGVYPFYK